MYKNNLLKQNSILKTVSQNNAECVRQFISDAFDAGAEVRDNSYIIYRIDEFSKVNSRYYGLYIGIYRDSIAVWIATDNGYGVRDGISISDFPIDISFNELVAKCKEKVNVCPVCGKKVGLANMTRYSFAGRCCSDCLPEMRRKYEQDGWYN